MPTRNYKAECVALLAHIKTQKEFDASTWKFDVYCPVRTPYVSIISTDIHDIEPFHSGDTRKTWREMGEFLRAYSQGFWHGVKTGLEAENARGIIIEIKTPPNRSGNVNRLYVEFGAGGYRQAVHANYDEVRNFHISDTLQVTTREFAEYKRLAK